MARRRDSWLEMARNLGEAFYAVVLAELEVVRETVKAWGKSWGIALAIAALVLFGLFWFLGLLTVAVVHGLMAWRDLVLWQAALVTAGAILLLAAAAAAVIYFLVRRYESPVAAARRRVDDHRRWWHDRVAPESPQLSEGESHEAHEQGDGASPGPASEPPSGG